MFSLTLHALISWPILRSFTSQAMVFLGVSHVIASLSFSSLTSQARMSLLMLDSVKTALMPVDVNERCPYS